MSQRIALRNTKSYYIHCCFTKALYHALDFLPCETRSNLILYKSMEIFNAWKREYILIWYICPITIEEV